MAKCCKCGEEMDHDRLPVCKECLTWICEYCGRETINLARYPLSDDTETCEWCWERLRIGREYQRLQTEEPNDFSVGFVGSDANPLLEEALRQLLRLRQRILLRVGPTRFVPCRCSWSETDLDYDIEEGIVRCALCRAEIGPVQ